MSIEEAWTNRQRTKERLLELADRAPSERFWQASNADDDAVLAFGHAVLEEADSPSHEVPLFERQACRTRLRARLAALLGGQP